MQGDIVIISLIITVLAVILFCEISFKMIAAGIIGSFVVSFVSMYGFDSLKSIFDRFTKGSNRGED